VIGGDAIQAVDGKAVVTPMDLAAEVARRQPGDTVTLTVQRGAETNDVEATLPARPRGG
jgi:putative serine protease PepD